MNEMIRLHKFWRQVILLWLLSMGFAAAQSLPNVIVIISDDQGSVDLNSFGATDLYTPHLDGLAESGVKFTQFYSAAPLCSPSRAALLTGLTPQGAGLATNGSSIKGIRGMPSDRKLIPEYLKPLGYKTAHIGKWHLGFSKDTMPLAQGFDYSFGHMGGAIDNYSHFFYWYGSNRHDLYENEEEVFHDGRYFPDLMLEKAQQFIADSDDQPFFMYYALNLPHYPVQPTAKWREHYKDMAMPRRDYAAFVSTIDENIGDLISTLEQRGIRDNTLIIFQSDHGHSMESRAFGGGSSGIYRGAKTSLFEGGIRVPAMISYPAKIKAGQVREQMAVGVDWLPTILDYIDQPVPELVGKTLKPMIEQNDATPHQVYYWKQGLAWAVRQGDWKLLGFPTDPQNRAPLDADDDQLFLANIEQDPSELTNLAKQHPDIVEQLTAQYLSWQYGDENDLPAKQQSISSFAANKPVKLLTKPSDSHAAAGGASLVDEKLGQRQFRLGNWLGFNATDLEAIIDFGEATEFHQVKVGALQHTASWIFLPTEIEVSWSTDGINYSKPLRISHQTAKDEAQILIKRFELTRENTVARYLKVTAKNIGKCPAWHVGNGQNAWLFIDEVSVL